MHPVASTSRCPLASIRHASTVAASSSSSAAASVQRMPFRGPLTLRPKSRRYPSTKAAKFAEYQSLFSASQLLLFLRVDSLSVKEVNTLRADLKAMLQQQRATQSPDEVPVDLTLTFLRANLVPPVLASLPHLPSNLFNQQHPKGPLAVVTSPHLHPPALAQFLRIFQKHAKEFNKPLEDASGKKPAPGAKKAAPVPRDRLVLRSGIAEQRQELTVADIQHLSTLPSLKGVQSQIIGMVDATAAQLVRVLSQASGAQVAQTLEGFKVGLEEQSGATPKESQA